MIKTYRYNELCNNVSLTISGAGGNSMRYNFTHGNTYMRKCPELTLRNKYAQDLLENSELFKKGLVSLVRSTPEPSDVIDDEPTEKEEVMGIHTSAEVIAYVNKRFDKEYKNLTNAMKCASKAGIIFPEFNE